MTTDASIASPAAPAAGGYHLGRFLRNAAIVVIVVGGGVGLWFGVLRERFVAKRFGEVTASIHRSGQISEYMVGQVLEEHGIQRIVDLTEPEYAPPGKVKEREVAKAKGIEVLNYPLVGDGTGDVDLYAKAVAALIEAEERHEPTLVHCAAGSYRTSGVVACFRILYQGWTREAALEEAKGYDWDPSKPELPRFLDENLEKIRAKLVASGVLEAAAPATPH